jgi:hypothetical protein
MAALLGRLAFRRRLLVPLLWVVTLAGVGVAATPRSSSARGGAGRAYEAAAPRSSLKIAEELACNYARALGSVAVTRGEAAAQVTQHPDTDLSNSQADSRVDSRHRTRGETRATSEVPGQHRG